MIDDTSGHKQGGLKGSVVNHMKNRRHCSKLRAHAEQQRDQAQVADR